MRSSFARKLIAVLLLLALVVGGERFGAMALDAIDLSGAHMSDMQKPDMGCKACDGMMADMPCDAACAVFPAIDGTALSLLPDLHFHERWMARSDSGATLSIRPDTSPPRA